MCSSGAQDTVMQQNGHEERPQAENVGILAVEAYFPNVVVSARPRAGWILPWAAQLCSLPPSTTQGCSRGLISAAQEAL